MSAPLTPPSSGGLMGWWRLFSSQWLSASASAYSASPSTALIAASSNSHSWLHEVMSSLFLHWPMQRRRLRRQLLWIVLLAASALLLHSRRVLQRRAAHESSSSSARAVPRDSITLSGIVLPKRADRLKRVQSMKQFSAVADALKREYSLEDDQGVTPRESSFAASAARRAHTFAPSSSVPLLNAVPVHLEAARRARAKRILSQSKFVACLGEELLDELAACLQHRFLNTNTRLFEPGPMREAGMFIVAEGRLGLHLPPSDEHSSSSSSSPSTPTAINDLDSELILPHSHFVSHRHPPRSHSHSRGHSRSRDSSRTHSFQSHQPMFESSAGDTLCEWTLICNPQALHSSYISPQLIATALEPSEVLFLSRVHFEAFIEHHPRSMLEFINAVARQWRIASYVLGSSVLDLPPRSREEAQGEKEAACLDLNASSSHSELLHSEPAAASASAAASSATTSSTDPSSSSSSVHRHRLSRLAGVRLIALEPFEVLFSAGEEANFLYVVESGHLEAMHANEHEDEVAAVIGERSLVGGMSWFGLTTRGETVRAGAEGARCWEYSTETIERVLSEDARAFLPIVKAVARQFAPVLAQFFNLGLDSRWLRSGSIVFDAGDEANSVYLVISGRVHAMIAKAAATGGDQNAAAGILQLAAPIVSEEAAATVQANEEASASSASSSLPPSSSSSSAHSETEMASTLFEVSRGELFGEDSPLGEDGRAETEAVVRSYTAVCVRDTEIVRLSSAAFTNLFSINPRSMLRFSRQISNRLSVLANKSFLALSGSSSREQSPLAIIALVWIGSAPWSGSAAVLAHFAARLCEKLEAFGKVATVDSASVSRVIGAASSTSSSSNAFDDMLYRSRASRHLSELEEEHRFILVLADPLHDEHEAPASRASIPSPFASSSTSSSSEPLSSTSKLPPSLHVASSKSAWSKMAVEQADCVLLVCDADSTSHQVSAAEAELLWNTAHTSSPSSSSSSSLSSSPSNHKDAHHDEPDRVDVRIARHKDLVVLHSQTGVHPLPSNTRAWFEGRALRSHHHIRRAVPLDFGRLARHLAGESIGVVLGGGGARGLAHLGALKAIEEANLPIDMIGGTSQGAFVSALYAQHLSADACLPITRDYASRFNWRSYLHDLTLPLLSYMTGEIFSNTVKEKVGQCQIEDTWIPVYVVCTNVTLGCIQVYRSGSLWRFTRASMTLLGVIPPVINDEGEILLDGGYCSNLPVVPMASEGPLKARTVIAVDVENRSTAAFQGLKYLSQRTDLGMQLSGWRLLWYSLVGGVKVPNFNSILLFLSFLSHAKTLKEAVKDGLIDLYIQPKTEHLALFDFDKFEEIVPLGYTAGKQAIDAWMLAREEAEQQAVRNRTDPSLAVKLVSEHLAKKVMVERLHELNSSMPITPFRSTNELSRWNEYLRAPSHSHSQSMTRASSAPSFEARLNDEGRSRSRGKRHDLSSMHQHAQSSSMSSSSSALSSLEESSMESSASNSPPPCDRRDSNVSVGSSDDGSDGTRSAHSAKSFVRPAFQRNPSMAALRHMGKNSLRDLRSDPSIASSSLANDSNAEQTMNPEPRIPDRLERRRSSLRN